MDRKRVLWDALTAYQTFCPDCSKELADAYISQVFAQESISDDFLRAHADYLAPVLDFNIDKQKSAMDSYCNMLESAKDAPALHALMTDNIRKASDALKNYLDLYRILR